MGKKLRFTAMVIFSASYFFARLCSATENEKLYRVKTIFQKLFSWTNLILDTFRYGNDLNMNG